MVMLMIYPHMPETHADEIHELAAATTMTPWHEKRQIHHWIAAELSILVMITKQ